MGEDEKRDYTETVSRLVSILGVLVSLSYIIFAWRYAASIAPLDAVLFWLWNMAAVIVILVLCLVLWGKP